MLILAGSFSVSSSEATKEAGLKASSVKLAPKEISDVEAINRWMTYYYMHPQPQHFVSALLLADKQGLLEGDSAAPMQAFASRVLAQNPDKLREWFGQLSGLTEKGKNLLLTAIWWSNTKESKDLLDSIASQLGEQAKTQFKKQIDSPAPEIDKMEIESPDVLDMLWACFCATGDEKYVKRLFTTLTWDKSDNSKDLAKMLITSAARWSLISNINQHEKVREICSTAEKQDAALKPYLEKLMADAALAAQKAEEAEKAAKAGKTEKSEKSEKSEKQGKAQEKSKDRSKTSQKLEASDQAKSAPTNAETREVSSEKPSAAEEKTSANP